MSDPLSDIIGLLQPSAPFSKLVSASGAWRVRRSEVDQVYYSVALKGSACLRVEGKPPVILSEGDFVLVPAARNFSMESVDPPPPDDLESTPVINPDGTVRVGDPLAPDEAQHLVGYCVFGSPDAALLVSLLPDMIVVRGENRLGVLAKLVREEALADRAARNVVLDHLLKILLIEALRSGGTPQAAPGLLQGLRDRRLAHVLRAIHAAPAKNWTVAELAKSAGMSRSALFAHFSATVGVAPIEYLLHWRMTLAKDSLRRGHGSIAEIASRVGYGSASAFNTAFARREGKPPGQYAQAHHEVAVS